MDEGSEPIGGVAVTIIGLNAGNAVFFVLATVVLLVGSPIANVLRNAILAKGISSEAKILKLAKTGTTINDSPVARLSLGASHDRGSDRT